MHLCRHLMFFSVLLEPLRLILMQYLEVSTLNHYEISLCKNITNDVLFIIYILEENGMSLPTNLGALYDSSFCNENSINFLNECSIASSLAQAHLHSCSMKFWACLGHKVIMPWQVNHTAVHHTCRIICVKTHTTIFQSTHAPTCL